MIYLFIAMTLWGIFEQIMGVSHSADAVLAFWNIALPAALGLVSGGMEHKAQQRQADHVNKMNALETEYSPWIAPSYQQAPQVGSQMGSMLSGGFTGGMMGAQLGGGGAKETFKAPAKNIANKTWAPQGNYFSFD